MSPRPPARPMTASPRARHRLAPGDAPGGPAPATSRRDGSGPGLRAPRHGAGRSARGDRRCRAARRRPAGACGSSRRPPGAEPLGERVLSETRPRLAEELEQRTATEKVEVIRVEMGSIRVSLAGRSPSGPAVGQAVERPLVILHGDARPAETIQKPSRAPRPTPQKPPTGRRSARPELIGGNTRRMRRPQRPKTSVRGRPPGRYRNARACGGRPVDRRADVDIRTPDRRPWTLSWSDGATAKGAKSWRAASRER